MSYLESSFCGAAGQKIKVCIQFSFGISIQESDQVDDHWVQENFTIENFSLTCRSIALFIWREREKKEVVTTTKIFMRKALILLFLSFIILRIWRWREYVSWKHRLGLSSGCLELIICVKIRIRFRDFEAGKGFLFNYKRQNYRDSRLPVCA